ncbi:MAG: YdcF family protein, partial [Alphaproteobacteria bacterium]|nr:YdcF family protein [Alphaproteobacteria bacterium]
AAWMAKEGYRSLRLVTAAYHMPRSLLEFHRAMPDLRLIPHPVFPDSVRLDAWWRHPGTVALLASEYAKYLLAHVAMR